MAEYETTEREQHIIHHRDGDYNKEVILTGINYSVFLKSNLKSDTLENMTALGIKRLKQVKQFEGEKNNID